ncbi:MAG: CRISPR-associated helicase Cas3' [Thermaceae bacterium]
MDERILLFWAKSGTPYHPLLGHMLDTAAVALEVLGREPSRTLGFYSEDLGRPPEEASLLTAFLAGLHDLGKATPVFQIAWEEWRPKLQEAGLGWDPWVEEEDNWVAHGVMTQVLLEEENPYGFPRRARKALARALGAHHGFVPGDGEARLGRDHLHFESDSWKVVRQALAYTYKNALGIGGIQWPQALSGPAVVRQMALASFADWIASDPDFFPYGRDLKDPKGYFQEAQKLAQKALDRLGWRKWHIPERAFGDPYRELFPGRIKEPNALQRAVASLLERSGDSPGPSLLLIEAPMGGGKTEAALFAHLHLAKRMEHRGFYFALPTQATGNGLFPRAKDFLERLYQEASVDLQLQHGANILNEAYQALLRPREVHDGEGGVVAEAWFSPRKRAMLSPYGVGTLDQALLSVLKVKHHFIRLYGLMNRTVISDEIHAYDTYTSGLLESLLSWLKALGSSVVLMTATLPEVQREALLKAYLGKEVDASLPPYPRVALFAGEKVHAESIPWEGKTYWLHKAPVRVEELSRLLLKKPGVVGVIVNTVDRAQRLYGAFGPGERMEENGAILGKRLGDGTEVYLFHARFPAEERARREEAILKRFGREGPRPQKAILIATQVVEQSLDLDFDLLFSDLAPVDLLLQRAGRLHRHDRERPEGLQNPQLYVMGLDGPEFRKKEGEMLFWDMVYEPYVLLATFVALEGRRSLKVPDDVEALLQEVYEAEPERFPEAYRGKAEEFHRSFSQKREGAKATADNLALGKPEEASSVLERGKGGQDLARGLDDDAEDERTQRLLTRLGEPSVGVVLAWKTPGGLYLDPEGRTPLPLEPRSPDEVRQIWGRSVRLSRFPIPQALMKEDPPSAWKGHGILRGLRVLEVGAVVEYKGRSLRVLLDPELGVVYEDPGSP